MLGLGARGKGSSSSLYQSQMDTNMALMGDYEYLLVNPQYKSQFRDDTNPGQKIKLRFSELSGRAGIEALHRSTYNNA